MVALSAIETLCDTRREAEDIILDAVALDALLDKLPPRQRLAGRYHWIDDLTVAETAHRLTIVVGSAERLLTKARRRLQILLRPPGGGDCGVFIGSQNRRVIASRSSHQLSGEPQ